MVSGCRVRQDLVWVRSERSPHDGGVLGVGYGVEAMEVLGGSTQGQGDPAQIWNGTDKVQLVSGYSICGVQSVQRRYSSSRSGKAASDEEATMKEAVAKAATTTEAATKIAADAAKTTADATKTATVAKAAEVIEAKVARAIAEARAREKKSRHHVIVSSGWWSYQTGHFPEGGAARGDDQRIALSAG